MSAHSNRQTTMSQSADASTLSTFFTGGLHECTRELTCQYLGQAIFTSYYSAVGFFYDYHCQELSFILCTTHLTEILSHGHFVFHITGKKLTFSCIVRPRTQQWLSSEAEIKTQWRFCFKDRKLLPGKANKPHHSASFLNINTYVCNIL